MLWIFDFCASELHFFWIKKEILYDVIDDNNVKKLSFFFDFTFGFIEMLLESLISLELKIFAQTLLVSSSMKTSTNHDVHKR